MRKQFACICFVLGLVLFQGFFVYADFQAFIVEHYNQQQTLIWQSTAEHYKNSFLESSSGEFEAAWMKKILAIFLFIVIVWILLWFLRRLFLEWIELKKENSPIEESSRFVDLGATNGQRLIQEGKAALRQDPMYATSKFQAALDLSLSEPQRKEVHHYLGIAYLERFRRENNFEDENNVQGSFMMYKNPYLLKESQVHLLEARRMGHGNDRFQLDNNSWLISLYCFLDEYDQALDISYEALNLAQNNGEEEKQEYLLNKISHLKKRLEKRESLEQKSKYPKELQPDTVEVL